MAEEAPPPAFYVESVPSSIHIPTNSLMSVEAEVFKEDKPSPVSSPAHMNNHAMNQHLHMDAAQLNVETSTCIWRSSSLPLGFADILLSVFETRFASLPLGITH